MKTPSIIIILILLLHNHLFAQEKDELDQVSNDICNLLVHNDKSKFIEKYAPTKEDFLESAYGDEAKNIGAMERMGFYSNISLSVKMVTDELSSSFDFVYNKISNSKIQKRNTVELKKVTKSKIGKTDVNNCYLILSSGENQFDLEILGLYKTSNGWKIFSDISPWYF